MKHLPILLLILLLASCATSQPTVITQTKVEYRHDTLHTIDSIFTDRVQYIRIKGDTVYHTDSVFLYRYKTIERTLTEHLTDSVPYPVEVVKYVPQRTAYDKAVSVGFWILLVMVVLLIGGAIVIRIAVAHF